MKIQLTARHLKLTPAIRDYVTQKIDKAQKYFDHIVWGQVVLFIEKRTHNAEIVIHAPRQTFRAIASAADLYSAVDLASDKIDAQLKKYKERLRDHHKTPEISPESEGRLAPGALQFSVIKRPVSPMTPEKAAAAMDTLGHAFMVFQDRDSMQIHVVYRRTDDSYGIVHPVKKTR